MEIITGYTGKPHVTSEQDRDVNIGVVGEGSYVLRTGMQLAAEVSSNNEIKIRDGVLMHQGCTASIKKNTYDSLTITNGIVTDVGNAVCNWHAFYSKCVYT